MCPKRPSSLHWYVQIPRTHRNASCPRYGSTSGCLGQLAVAHSLIILKLNTKPINTAVGKLDSRKIATS